MDLITQLQNYVGYLSVFMTSSIEQIHTQAPPVMPPSLHSPPPSTPNSSHPSLPSSSSSTSVPLSIPPPPTLDPSFTAVLDDKALTLYKRITELQTLIHCLPAHLSSEEEQLNELVTLQAMNDEEEERWKEVKEEADLWQRRLAWVLQKAAAEQLRIGTAANQGKAMGQARGRRGHVVEDKGKS